MATVTETPISETRIGPDLSESLMKSSTDRLWRKS